MPEEMLRLFVAVELPERVRMALQEVQAELGAARLPLRLVRPEGIHLTLAFLGDTPAGRGPALSAAITEGVEGVPVFTLRAAGLGMFPNARRPRVVWVGIEAEAPGDPSPLAPLHQGVVAALHAAGFTCDTRFTPHLTLARVRDDAAPGALAAIGPLVQTLHVPTPLVFDVAHVSLMQSELRREGALYTRLDAIPLAPTRPAD